MLVGSLYEPETYQTLLNHGPWETAFQWLNEHRRGLPADGEYPLLGDDMRAIVQTVALKKQEECVFESHRREIDLQCCFDGDEMISWAPAGILSPKTEYDAENDFTLYEPPAYRTTVRMTPGIFAVFFPVDGHMPGIGLEGTHTRKVVIKINTELFTDKPAVLGPFETAIAPGKSVETLFDGLIAGGQFDKVNRVDIAHENFPFSTTIQAREVKQIYLVNFSVAVHNDDAPRKLAKLGYRPVMPGWVLALNAQYPKLMNEHIIITTETSWIGREDAPEVICLHKDAGKRRLRTHYADTNWGPHIWFACEKIEN